MAFFDKYKFSFKNNFNRAFTVTIAQEAFGGSVEIVENPFAVPCVIDYLQQDDIFFPVKGTTCIIGLKCPVGDDLKFEEFFTAPFMEFRCTVKDDTSNTIIFQGFNVPDEYEETFDDTPYLVNVKFTCGLGRLKGIEFEASPGVFHTGTMHLIEVMRHCLNQINPIEIREAYNVYEASHTETSADSPLVQTLVVSDTYRVVKQNQEHAMSCYDVLAAVLRSIGAFVCYADGRWHVIRVRELQTSPLSFRDFLPAVGSENNISVNVSGSLITTLVNGTATAFPATADMVQLNRSGLLSSQKKIQRLIYRYRDNWWADFTEDKEFKTVKGGLSATAKAGERNIVPMHSGSILKNSNFDHELGLDPHPLPLFWKPSGSLTAAQMRSFTNPATIAPSAKKFVNVLVVTPGSVFDSTLFMSQKLDTIFVNNTDKIRLQFSYFLSPSTSTAYLKGFVKIKLTDVANSDIYYFKENGTWFQDNTGGGVLASVVFNVVPDTVDSITKAYHRKLLSTADVPFKGEATLEIFFYRTAKIGVDNLNSLKLQSLLVLYHLPSGSLPPKEFIRVEEIDSVDTGDTYEIDAFHDDGQSYVSLRSFREDNSVKDITTAWHRTGIGEALNMHQIVINDVLNLRANNNKRLSAEWHCDGKIKPYSLVTTTVVKKSGSSVWDAAVEGFSYDVMNGIYQASLIEMLDHSFSSTPSDFGNDIGEVGDQPSGGGGGTTGGSTGGSSGFSSGGEEGSNFPN